jgi:hypothetical protein
MAGGRGGPRLFERRGELCRRAAARDITNRGEPIGDSAVGGDRLNVGSYAIPQVRRHIAPAEETLQSCRRKLPIPCLDSSLDLRGDRANLSLPPHPYRPRRHRSRLPHHRKHPHPSSRMTKSSQKTSRIDSQGPTTQGGTFLLALIQMNDCWASRDDQIPRYRTLHIDQRFGGPGARFLSVPG